MTLNVGAWIGGGYKRGDTGTLGESLTLQSDNTGWAIRSWKYALDYSGFTGLMKLDSPTMGDAMVNQVLAFQTQKQLVSDGVIGPKTGEALLAPYLFIAVRANLLRAATGIVAHESAWDLGAIGYTDHNDRGATQVHLGSGVINLSQAIRPALAIPRLGAQLLRLTQAWDEDAAIVSWNCGEAGAEWWFDNGKPTTGSPDWWPYGDLGARATTYLIAIRASA